MSTSTKLKAPFPYFGGKRAIAGLAWSLLGDCRNTIEPFCGSMAFLLARPHPPKIETINDKDCMVANFWRAVQADPVAVARECNWPVNEADLHARHRWLVLSDEAKAFRERIRRDPTYYDVIIAAWWCWGLCCWIGGGWCTPASDDPHERRPLLSLNTDGAGVHRKLPRLNGGRRGDESYGGLGVHADNTGNPSNWGERPQLSREGYGVHQGLPPWEWEQRPRLEPQGVNAGRPQLADVYARGRGVHGNDNAGTCDARERWLIGWFASLRDRLRTVRVCCGEWHRICSSRSTTTRIGLTGVFLDPPYAAETGRDMNLYAQECGKVSHEVRKWCLEYGTDPQMRIVLCGKPGEHDELVDAGWRIHDWKTQGGYANRGKAGEDDHKAERIWISPHCLSDAQGGLFE